MTKRTTSPDFFPDRLGRFIGQLRVHEGVTLAQLAHGLCSVSLLNRIENGEREVSKQLADTFFQRLGKSAGKFTHILDWKEFQRWKSRQEIISHLRNGDVRSAERGIQEYACNSTEVLDQQFARIVEINCRQLSGAGAEELLSLVRDALLLTQPTFLTVPISTLLLSRNEGQLLFAYLRLREQLEGGEAVVQEYHDFLLYFKQERYENRERTYLSPAIACCIIENDYREGRYSSALAICEDALAELTKAQSLFSYDRLLEWKQVLYDALGKNDRTPEKLLARLRRIQEYAPPSVHPNLLIPCEEIGSVSCLNQVIRDRRRLLGISQESLADGVCTVRALSRIETLGGNVHRKNRKLLLQKLNMSGEQYDGTIITDRYEDYLLVNKMLQAPEAGKIEDTGKYLSDLRQRLPATVMNAQFIESTNAFFKLALPQDHPERIDVEEFCRRIEAAIYHTLPLDLMQIDTWPIGGYSVTVSEHSLLVTIAYHSSRLNKPDLGLSLLVYLKRCMEKTDVSARSYRDVCLLDYFQALLLGDSGRYQESNSLHSNCIKLSLENQDSARLANSVQGLTWNLARQLPCGSCHEKTELRENVLSSIELLYAAGVISGKIYIQKNASDLSRRIFGVEQHL